MTFHQVSKEFSIRPADTFSPFPGVPSYREIEPRHPQAGLAQSPAIGHERTGHRRPGPMGENRRPSSGPSTNRESDGIIGSRRDRRGEELGFQDAGPYNFFLASEQPLRERFYLEAIPFNTGTLRRDRKPATRPSPETLNPWSSSPVPPAAAFGFPVSEASSKLMTSVFAAASFAAISSRFRRTPVPVRRWTRPKRSCPLYCFPRRRAWLTTVDDRNRNLDDIGCRRSATSPDCSRFRRRFGGSFSPADSFVSTLDRRPRRRFGLFSLSALTSVASPDVPSGGEIAGFPSGSSKSRRDSDSVDWCSAAMGSTSLFAVSTVLSASSPSSFRRRPRPPRRPRRRRRPSFLGSPSGRPGRQHCRRPSRPPPRWRRLIVFALVVVKREIVAVLLAFSPTPTAALSFLQLMFSVEPKRSRTALLFSFSVGSGPS